MKPFCRLKLLASMLFLLAAIAAVVILASPYAPVVQPVRDIEEIWSIEDAREESEEPLLTKLENNGVALGYDWYENTFYCTLGMDNADSWPDIHLTAPEAKGIEVCFVDDYTYDWCSDAIAQGYPYQIIAYNDEQFSYAQIVFTGLPIVTMTTREDILPHEDIPAQVSWSFDAQNALESHARTHKRGAASLFFGSSKIGYKIEFTRNSDGTKKLPIPVENMGLTDDVVLLPCLNDRILQDRLCWDLYGMLVGKEEPFGKRGLFFTELFINEEYQGVYLALEPFDYAAELNKESASAAQTDSVYRTFIKNEMDPGDRPEYFGETGADYEAHYTMQKADRVFEPLTGLIELFSAAEGQEEWQDEIFCEAITTCVDLDSFLQYSLFVQACCLWDNVYNNMYIWAEKESNGYMYRFIPWDMDVSWGPKENYEDVKWILTPLFDRAIELDCGGIIRTRMLDMWHEMRESVMNVETIERLVSQYVYELQNSGAFYRDAVRWGKSISYLDGYSFYDYANLRFNMLDRRIEEMASEEYRGRRLEIGEYETVVLGQ